MLVVNAILPHSRRSTKALAEKRGIPVLSAGRLTSYRQKKSFAHQNHSRDCSIIFSQLRLFQIDNLNLMLRTVFQPPHHINPTAKLSLGAYR